MVFLSASVLVLGSSLSLSLLLGGALSVRVPARLFPLACSLVFLLSQVSPVGWFRVLGFLFLGAL